METTENPPLSIYRYHINEHPFEPYERTLRETPHTVVLAPKDKVPDLPQKLEKHYPALGMLNEDALASYRDFKLNDSLHVIEYPDHWRLHIDRANPRFPEKRMEHALEVLESLFKQ